MTLQNGKTTTPERAKNRAKWMKAQETCATNRNESGGTDATGPHRDKEVAREAKCGDQFPDVDVAANH